MIRLITGDCVEQMALLAEESIDAIVTDPPYHLTTGKKGGTGPASVNLDSPAGRARVSTGFMGMQWDGGDVAMRVETWAAALRVLKPGGHLLAFSGTRTYHRMVCAIEDAGFEIRDQIGWLYGSGFPKSLDVSKAITATQKNGSSSMQSLRKARLGEGYKPTGQGDPNGDNFGKKKLGWTADGDRTETDLTPDGERWQGWGTAIKPAWEPIVIARKPLIGTVAANVLRHGTGALNIDGCRVGEGGGTSKAGMSAGAPTINAFGDGLNTAAFGVAVEGLGRWPANIIHDGSDEVLAAFPQAPGAFAPVRGSEPSAKTQAILGEFGGRAPSDQRDGGGSAARFFYTAKASAFDRNDGTHDLPQAVVNITEGHGRGSINTSKGDGTGQRVNKPRGNHHPTVKPTDLMRYLCRLVTPPGGTVLDPFAGSGSTLKAAELEGFSAIGIELDPAYAEIARRRVASDAPLFAPEVTG